MDDGDGWWCFPLPAPKQQCVANIFRAPEAAKVLITVRHFTWNQEEVVGDGVCGQKLFAIIMDAKIVTKFKLFSFILVFSGWGAREMLPLLVLCWLFCLWLRWWNLIYRQSCFRLLVCIYFQFWDTVNLTELRYRHLDQTKRNILHSAQHQPCKITYQSCGFVVIVRRFSP